MSKRTLILVILLVVVSVGLIYAAAHQGKKSVNPMPEAMVTPEVMGHTVLSLIPSATAQTNSIDIHIDTLGDNVTAVQAELMYDPTIITNVHITQGTFFQDPIVLFNQVDQKSGRISYAQGIRPLDQPQKGMGTIGTITYNLMPKAKGPVTLTFLPKTKVTAEGVLQSVLKTANSITITTPSGTMMH